MSSNAEHTPAQHTENHGYDRSDPEIPGVLVTTAAIILVLIVVGVGVEYYYNQYRGRIIDELQLEPVSQDLLELRSKEDKELSSYAVTDKATGVYRLPVSRAIDLVINEAKDGRQKYPTASYIVKKAEDEAATAAAPASK